jgi:hypothetical protein
MLSDVRNVEEMIRILKRTAGRWEYADVTSTARRVMRSVTSRNRDFGRLNPEARNTLILAEVLRCEPVPDPDSAWQAVGRTLHELQLPPHHLQLLHLRLFFQLRPREIAKLLGRDGPRGHKAARTDKEAADMYRKLIASTLKRLKGIGRLPKRRPDSTVENGMASEVWTGRLAEKTKSLPWPWGENLWRTPLKWKDWPGWTRRGSRPAVRAQPGEARGEIPSVDRLGPVPKLATPVWDSTLRTTLRWLLLPARITGERSHQDRARAFHLHLIPLTPERVMQVLDIEQLEHRRQFKHALQESWIEILAWLEKLGVSNVDHWREFARRQVAGY